MYYHASLDDNIRRIKMVGDMLVPCNPPIGHASDEDEIYTLKTSELLVDGYEIVVYYTKSDFSEYESEVIQIYNKNAPFLPFNVVCKLARRFLGDNNLSLVELFKGNRKIYCWSVCVKGEKAIPPPYDVESEKCDFEGLSYAYVQPGQVNFY